MFPYSSFKASQSSQLRLATQNPWGIRGNRPDTTEALQTIRKRATEQFCEANLVRDESRWIALYVTESACSIYFLMAKAGIRLAQVEQFCSHYGVDCKTRNFVANNREVR